ncbi:MAG: TonB-dependent receptor [Bacteroidota bacterium]
MKKKLLLLFAFLLCLGVYLEAQGPQRGGRPGRGGARAAAKITGTIVDSQTGVPLEYATISLFRRRDSSLVTGIVTDLNGNFTLDTRPGRFFAKIEFLAYQSKVIPQLAIERGQALLELGKITLESDAAVLEEVVVQADRSQMQLSLDKKIFNVGKDLASRGGTATDLLDNVPSVQVDVEGGITLRGSGNVQILVDGRPSGLISAGNANGLRSLPANLIERVEVITNPSARYEAEGMAGIINIVLKKERKSGLNGSFDFNGGLPESYGTAINLNYRASKLNFFTNLGFNRRQRPGSSYLYQEVYNGDTTLISEQRGDRERIGLNANLRLGVDYSFTPKSTLTSSFTFRGGRDDNFNSFIYRDFLNSSENPTGISRRTDDEIENEYELQYTLRYKKTYDRKGQQLTADIRYEDNSEDEGSDLVERYFTKDDQPSTQPTLIQRSDNKEGTTRLSGQVDYTQPILKDGTMEMGWRTSLRQIDNDFEVNNILANGEKEPLIGLTNEFVYNEDIHAAYLIFGNKQGKISYQVGLRAEYSDIRTELKETNEVNARDYLNLFPSGFLNFELPASNAIQLSYSRRVRRPRFWDLNPFFTFSDNRNFFAGNPNLDPEFTHSMEFGHVKYWEKGSLSSAIYYRHTTGKIQRVREVNDDGTTLLKPQNLSTEDNFGFEFNISYSALKWWRLDMDLNLFRSIVDGSNFDQSFDADTYSWFTRGTSRFTLDKQTDVQIRFNYRAPQETIQGRRKSITSIDIAASRDVLNKKGTLTLSIRDVFNSRRRRYTTVGDNFFNEGDFQWRARIATLTFSYRLNQKKRRGGRRGGGGYDGGDGGGMY